MLKFKRLRMPLLVGLLFTLTACGSTATEATITLTVPLSIFGMTVTQEECDLAADVENITQLTLNSDNTVTALMTEKRYEGLLKQADAYIKNGLKNGDYLKKFPEIAALTRDESGTVYTAKLKENSTLTGSTLDLKYNVFYYAQIDRLVHRENLKTITIRYEDTAGKLLKTEAYDIM